MFTEWIQDRLIDSRLDAYRYTPRFVAAYSRLMSLPIPNSRLEDQRDQKTPINYGILQPRKFLSDGVPMVRAVDLGNPFVDKDRVVKVPHDVEAPYHRSRLKSGDMLISIAGSLGAIGLCPNGWSLANVNQSVARVRVSKDGDSGFIAAFLMSSLGQLLLEREAVGSVQRHLNIEDVREVKVIVPNLEKQRAIGDKIRKAERLAALARHNLQVAQNAIDAFYGPMEMNAGPSSGWLHCDHLSPLRLDSWFNQPRNVLFGDKLEERADLAKLRTFCRHLTKQVKWDAWPSDTFGYFEIGGIDSHPGQITSQFLRVSDAPSRAKFAVRPWDVLVSTVRPNLKNIAFVPEGTELAVCSSGFSVLRAESPEIAAYIWACLVHDVATQQLMRWNTGGTYPAIERSVPLEIYVPAPGDDKVNELGTLVVNATRWNRESRGLIESAKADVEDLIDGTLDEKQLLAKGEETAAWLATNPLPESERISV